MTDRKPVTPRLYEIPANATGKRCECGVTMYWIRSETSGKRIPVDSTVAGGIVPQDGKPGAGINHFHTCPLRDQFKIPRKPPPPKAD